MASVRGLLAKWLGGAGAIPQAGIRSLLARWVGGAGTTGLSQGGGVFSGSADVARTRSYEPSGGGVFDGSATVAQISGQQDFSVIVAFPVAGQPESKPQVKEPKQGKRRVRQTYSYVPDGGLELSSSAAVARSRAILASGGITTAFLSAASRVRSITASSKFIVSGSALVSTYDAIYDTEDEEFAMLMAAMA